MSYFIIILLLGIVGFVEYLIVRKGMKAAGRTSSYSRDSSGPSPSSSLTNKYVRRKERQQESLPKQEEAVEFVDRGEDVVSVPEKSQKMAELSDIEQEIRRKESPVQEQSMLDIIQEIRGESAHTSQDSHEPSHEPVKPAIELETQQEEMDLAKAESTKEPVADVKAMNDEKAVEADSDREETENKRTPSDQEVIEEVEKKVPPEELIRSGLELIRQGQLDRGIKKIEEAIEHVPEKTDAHFNLGIAYTLKENIPQAISAYQRAIEIDPRYGKAFFNLGTLYLKQGKVKKAIAKLEQAVKLLPDSMKALWNLYEAYRSSGLFTKALSSLQKLIELEPEDASLYNHLGICYVKLGDYTRAIDSWKRSIDLGASSQLIHYNLGKTYELYGDFAAAKDHYKQFITLASKISDWKELVAEVQDRLDNLPS